MTNLRAATLSLLLALIPALMVIGLINTAVDHYLPMPPVPAPPGVDDPMAMMALREVMTPKLEKEISNLPTSIGFHPEWIIISPRDWDGTIENNYFHTSSEGHWNYLWSVDTGTDPDHIHCVGNEYEPRTHCINSETGEIWIEYPDKPRTTIRGRR